MYTTIAISVYRMFTYMPITETAEHNLEWGGGALLEVRAD